MTKKKIDENEIIQNAIITDSEPETVEGVSVDVMDRETNSILIGEPDSQEDEVMSSEETPKPKTKRVKKKTEAESMAENAEETQGKPEYSEVTEQPQSAGQKRRNEKINPILTLEAGGSAETEESAADTVWHEIHNAYRTRRIMTGMLGGIEQLEGRLVVELLRVAEIGEKRRQEPLLAPRAALQQRVHGELERIADPPPVLEHQLGIGERIS